MDPVQNGGPCTPGPYFVPTSWGSRALISIPRKVGSPFFNKLLQAKSKHVKRCLMIGWCCLLPDGQRGN